MNTIQWRANYNDGTSTDQYEGDVKRKYEDIDRTRLTSFSLFKDNYSAKILTFHLEKDQKLIFRKRVIQTVGETPIDVYLVGWQQNVNGQNIQSIAYVFPNGQIEIMGAWKGDHILFGKVELLDQEQI